MKILSFFVPNILLNGAIGIAVEMKTHIPRQNITELIIYCLHVYYNLISNIEEILEIVLAPDYPCGDNISSSKEENADVYKLGNG
ncbi:DNA gyrase subunit A [Francisella tularensis]|uniref:DNA gyrase subunit A n=1 Tax=Francisella tularensis TaxID=263 RepID=UPI0029660698|nr:DNA gyrase subunit A [Francisella tularensis]